MNSFASSLLNRLQDIVGSNSQNLQAFGRSSHGLSAAVTVPTTITDPQDRKVVEKCYRAMDSVCHLCRQPGLNLKKSPPCIIDILPEIYVLLDTIFNTNPDILQRNDYIQLFINNLSAKCKHTIRIFKDERTKIFEESSKARRNLTMKALIFSHMASELRSQFSPDGLFIGDKFRITKKEAAEFWTNSFQTRTVVSWEQFRDQFTSVHPVSFGMEMHALKSTIDLTVNDHVSNFEFDVFTRLFQPWPTLLKNWQVLAVTHPAYVAFLTYEEVKWKLQKFVNKPGSYVFRQSCTKLGQWAIGYVGPDRKIYQTIPQNKSLIQSLVDGSREGFYVYPNGKNKNVDLSYALFAPSHDRMKVTSEQYQIYCEMGTTFEMCKICDERNKNVKLEPCGHLLCKPCLYSWEQSADGGSSCPFCRCEIKGTENVVIDSYQPLASENAKSVPRQHFLPPFNERKKSGAIGSSGSKHNHIESKRINNCAESSVANCTSDEQRIQSNLSKSPQTKRPNIPPRSVPPPLPPKRVSSPYLPNVSHAALSAIDNGSHSSSPNSLFNRDASAATLCNNVNPTCTTKIQSNQTSFGDSHINYHKADAPIATSSSTVFEPDPFASIPNPFVEEPDASASGQFSASGAPESLPLFTDFMEMDLTRN